MSLINIKINGMPLSVPAGTTILEAAREFGIEIPTLCHMKDLNEIGACFCYLQKNHSKIQIFLSIPFLIYNFKHFKAIRRQKEINARKNKKSENFSCILINCMIYCTILEKILCKRGVKK